MTGEGLDQGFMGNENCQAPAALPCGRGLAG